MTLPHAAKKISHTTDKRSAFENMSAKLLQNLHHPKSKSFAPKAWVQF